MSRTLILVVLVALAVAAPAVAATSYAGLTRAAAIEKAKATIVGLEIATNGASPQDAARYRRTLDALPATARKASCHGSRAWRVSWPKSDPVFVNRRGLVMACYVR